MELARDEKRKRDCSATQC